jgi:hypothetical protein
MSMRRRKCEWMKPPYIEIPVLGEVPRHVLGEFPHRVIFIKTEGCTDIQVAVEGQVGRRAEKMRFDIAYPSKPMRSLIVPTVKSAMKYIPREWISSITALQSSIVPQ